jgi:hypothetical protein
VNKAVNAKPSQSLPFKVKRTPIIRGAIYIAVRILALCPAARDIIKKAEKPKAKAPINEIGGLIF